LFIYLFVYIRPHESTQNSKNEKQETQLSLTNRATRIEIYAVFTFENTATLKAGLGVTEGNTI